MSTTEEKGTGRLGLMSARVEQEPGRRGLLSTIKEQKLGRLELKSTSVEWSQEDWDYCQQLGSGARKIGTNINKWGTLATNTSNIVHNCGKGARKTGTNANKC